MLPMLNVRRRVALHKAVESRQEDLQVALAGFREQWAGLLVEPCRDVHEYSVFLRA